MGLLMVGASRAEASQVRTSAALAGVRVRDILPPDGGLGPHRPRLADGRGLPRGCGRRGTGPHRPTAYPVRDFDGQLSGLVTLTQLLGVPAGRRDATRLSQVATPVAYLAFTTLDEPLTDLRARLTHGGHGARPARPPCTPRATPWCWARAASWPAC